jgi:hypothetical protein
VSIKVRCTTCRKKLTVDDAFAGGVCRCPACKELFLVRRTQGVANGGLRPDAPPLHDDAGDQRWPGAASMPAPIPASAVHTRRSATGIVVAVLFLAATAGIVLLIYHLLGSMPR